MSSDEKNFVNDLIRGSICDIVRLDKIQRFIDEGVFKCVNDVNEVYDNAEKYITIHA